MTTNIPKLKASLYRDTFEALSNISHTSKKELKEALKYYEEDKSFMNYVISRDANMIKYCEKLKNDRDFILEKISNNGTILEMLSEELKNDPVIVYEATKSFILSIEYASEELKNNPIFIRDTIKKLKEENKNGNGILSGQLLRYASEAVKDNENIVYDITDMVPYAIEYASDRLKDNKRIFLNILGDYPFLIQFASEKIKRDEDIVSLVMKTEPRAYIYISENLKAEDKYISMALKHDGAALANAPLSVKENKEYVLMAITSCENAYKYAGDNMKKDNEVIESSLKINPKMIEFVPEECQEPYINIVLKGNPELFEKISENLKYNLDIIEYTYEEVKKKNKNFSALYQKNEMLGLLPKDLREDIESSQVEIEEFLAQIKFSEKLEDSIENKVVRNKKKI